MNWERNQRNNVIHDNFKKYLVINLTKKVKDISDENLKMLIKEIKEDKKKAPLKETTSSSEKLTHENGHSWKWSYLGLYVVEKSFFVIKV